MYGGMDWVASFIGGVFALLCGSVLLKLLSGTVPNPLLTFGLVSLIAHFLGGYVAGRLARFDGGRNGAATVLWGMLLGLVLALFGSGVLPRPLFGFLKDFSEVSIVLVVGLAGAGSVGLVMLAGALMLVFLGGFLGGRLGTWEIHFKAIRGRADWLASFIGCVFALVCVGALLSSNSVLDPLGLALEGQEINNAVVTSLAIVGLVLFVAHFLGGYVAGRLARSDGGRNGAATVWWSILLGLVLALFDNLLPVDLFGQLRAFAEDSLVPSILTGDGLIVLGIIVGALLLGRLGGSIGGRLGNRYHARIDSTP
jgi:hypothetical protein